jgi:hypothetical protein
LKFTWWKSGTWNTICDRCGFKFKAEELREEWDKLMVCKDCWEIRHPQDLIRPIPDQAKLPWTRPESTDQFISVTYTADHSCPINGEFAQADYGAADCAIVDNINGSFLP